MTNEVSVSPEIFKSVNSQEVSSLADSARSERGAGNRMRGNLQKSESPTECIQIEKICESASFCTQEKLQVNATPDMDHII